MEIKAANSLAEIGTRSLTDVGALNDLRTIADKRQQAEQVATQFESVFMEMMMKAMRATVPEGSLSESLGGKNYVSMLDQQYAQMGGMTFDPRFHQRLVDSIMDQSATAAEAAQRAEEKKGRIAAGETLTLNPGELASFDIK